ncbi:hypothetical protein JAAARDRAFT_319339 [Jaapia argillacea MUCL 33604]|uniref:Uncharacterized protein n=1 Tax=Jaapia argillacea MUCL 33604 TaxID=933084 RepID=A0A067PXQ2_9AGAM|nr:hypothetical protein JAAARDRAFT_319339 [Jaapia argillacea MUCL 33604]
MSRFEMIPCATTRRYAESSVSEDRDKHHPTKPEQLCQTLPVENDVFFGAQKMAYPLNEGACVALISYVRRMGQMERRGRGKILAWKGHEAAPRRKTNVPSSGNV